MKSKGYSEYIRYSIQDFANFDEENDNPKSNHLISYPQTPEDRNTGRYSENPDYVLMSIESVSPMLPKSLSRKKKKNLLSEDSKGDEFDSSKYDMKKDKNMKTSEFSSRNSEKIIKIKRKK